jgi:hypothetical protein
VARVVIGGLLRSALLTLVVIPVIYSLLVELHRRGAGSGGLEATAPALHASLPTTASIHTGHHHTIRVGGQVTTDCVPDVAMVGQAPDREAHGDA